MHHIDLHKSNYVVVRAGDTHVEVMKSFKELRKEGVVVKNAIERTREECGNRSSGREVDSNFYGGTIERNDPLRNVYSKEKHNNYVCTLLPTRIQYICFPI